MQFYLEQYTSHKEQATKGLQKGDYEEARYHLLSAAKYLLKAAQETEPNLKKIRHQNALRLREMALGLPKGTATAADGKGPPVTDQESGLTPEKKWLVAEKPNVHFSQIAGLDAVKEAISLRVIEPLRHPDVADRFRKKAGGGILLYGPPGTGKTMVAKAVATELDAQFFNVKSSNIMSQWVGVAEQNLAKLFRFGTPIPDFGHLSG